MELSGRPIPGSHHLEKVIDVVGVGDRRVCFLSVRAMAVVTGEKGDRILADGTKQTKSGKRKI